MSPKRKSAEPDKSGGGFRAYWALGGLVIGLLLGMASDRLAPGARAGALAVASFVGTLWLNALKMTVIPLVVTLLVTGIARSAEAAQGGRVAARSVLWIVIICTVSAIFGALLMLLLTSVFPLARETAGALQTALASVEGKAPAALPGIAEFFKGVVPPNVLAAATNGDVLPLVVFALLFGLALTRVGRTGRAAVVNFFEAVAEALLVIIAWVLALAPIGVLALAFTVGNEAGGAAFAGLGHYIILISTIGLLWMLLGAYPMGIIVGRKRPAAFLQAMIGPQAVAISTRSSLASLPAMLSAARVLGIREQVADVSLPLAVALFRSTGPAMNTAVAFYVAHWLGLHPSPAQMIAATAVGAVMSYGAISLPGEITFISSIAPICIALGAPIAPLALLVAVEMIPDIFRTLGNVTFDVALAAAVDRSPAETPER
ncbi:MAG TPA: dicarboxylate/amino acid:cation symporter [Sphingomicrobium sp.]